MKLIRAQATAYSLLALQVEGRPRLPSLTVGSPNGIPTAYLHAGEDDVAIWVVGQCHTSVA